MRKRRILLVDDDEIVQAVSERSLRRWGYEVATAASTRQALAQARRLGPDLLLVDQLLPDGDGVELARRIVDERGEAAPWVLVLSASYDQEWPGDGGVVARYLPKGMDPRRLRALIEAILSNPHLSLIPTLPAPHGT